MCPESSPAEIPELNITSFRLGAVNEAEKWPDSSGREQGKQQLVRTLEHYLVFFGVKGSISLVHVLRFHGFPLKPKLLLSGNVAGCEASQCGWYTLSDLALFP